MATTKTDPKLAVTANGAKKSKLYEGLTREQLIQASMADLLAGRTTFVIAHRLSTIRRADLILLCYQRRNVAGA